MGTSRTLASRALLTLSVVFAASLLAVVLQSGLGVQRISMLYLASVLLIAAWLGVSFGLVAAILAAVAFNFTSGAPVFQLSLGTRQDLANLIVFSTGAWVAGFYADGVQRTRDALGRLARPDPGLGNRRLDDASRPRRAISRDWPRELLRVIQALSLALAAAGLGWLIQEQLGIPRVSLIYVAAVVVSAILLGTRFGLITGVAGVVAFDYFVTEPHYTLALDSAQAALNLAVFLPLAWWVGGFAERVRYERRAVRSLFDAGRSLSATADEADLRRILCDAIIAATGGQPVAIADETGGWVRHGRAPLAPRAGKLEPGQTYRSGPWRTRALYASGRAYGDVTWYSPSVWRGLDAPLDRTVNVLIDLGAGALARARLSADHSRMEAIAQAEELRRAVLASISHDLRTPLSGILGSATSLLDFSSRYKEAVRRDLLENIRDQALRLNRYVDNLLGMTRLETGTLKPEMGPVEVEPLIFDVLEGLARGPQSTDVEVDSRLRVLADMGFLRHVLVNVLENALKYSPAGARVEVTSCAARGSVEIVVQDAGHGIQDGDLPQLFEPFFRGRGAKAGGVGLGLFVARGFMQAMGGSIVAERRCDGRQGLRVVLKLTAAEGIG